MKRQKKTEEDTNVETEKNPKLPEPPKDYKDYIHVRARRGQATDSHSLAERVSLYLKSTIITPFFSSKFKILNSTMIMFFTGQEREDK